MRCLLALSLLAAPGLLACAESDPPPQYIDIAYQVRCLDCKPAALDEAEHDITAVADESTYKISCRTEGSKPLLTFSVQGAAGGDSFSFKMLDTRLSNKDPGDGCKVTVIEGSNTYEGRCTAGDPTNDQPCQVRVERKNDIIEGSVLCREIPNALTPLVTRNVVAPNKTTAAKFEIHGCTKG